MKLKVRHCVLFAAIYFLCLYVVLWTLVTICRAEDLQPPTIKQPEPPTKFWAEYRGRSE